MNRKEYLSKFSRAVRWRLSASQAEEVIADYTEMLNQDISDVNIEEKWGTPYKAAQLLGERKGYYIWLMIFALLTTWLLVPVLWILRPGIYNLSYVFDYGALFVGIALCLAIFRPSLEGVASCPKKLIHSMIALLCLQILIMGAISVLLSYGDVLPAGLPYGRITSRIIRLWGLAAAVTGIWAVFQSRTKDYRWRALYILGLTGVLIVVMIYQTIGGMNLIEPNSEAFYRVIASWWIYGTVGLMGAVLCLKKI